MRKPYRRSCARLLARIIAFAEVPTTTAGHVETRRMLAAVLEDGPHVVLGDAQREILGDGAPLWPDVQLAAFQAELRGFFRGLIQDDEDVGMLVPLVTFKRLEVGTAPAGSAVLLTVDGATRDVLWFQIISLLHVVGVPRVVICPAPACGHWFVREGKREYCSERCQSRAYMQKYRGPIQTDKIRRERRLSLKLSPRHRSGPRIS